MPPPREYRSRRAVADAVHRRRHGVFLRKCRSGRGSRHRHTPGPINRCARQGRDRNGSGRRIPEQLRRGRGHRFEDLLPTPVASRWWAVLRQSGCRSAAAASSCRRGNLPCHGAHRADAVAGVQPLHPGFPGVARAPPSRADATPVPTESSAGMCRTEHAGQSSAARAPAISRCRAARPMNLFGALLGRRATADHGAACDQRRRVALAGSAMA